MNNPYKPPFTLEDLEKLKTHELAELISNLVLLFRRLPNVPVAQLTAPREPEESTMVPTRETPDLITRAQERVNGSSLPNWTNQD